MNKTATANEDFLQWCGRRRFGTILADPPWRFQNSTGKVAPEHRRLSRYGTMSLEEISNLPVGGAASTPAHLYLWVPNALLAEGLAVMAAWGFTYKSNIVWHKIRKDGGSDGRGVAGEHTGRSAVYDLSGPDHIRHDDGRNEALRSSNHLLRTSRRLSQILHCS